MQCIFISEYVYNHLTCNHLTYNHLTYNHLTYNHLTYNHLTCKINIFSLPVLVIWDGWLRQTGHLGHSVPKILRFLFDSELKEPVSETGSDPCYGKCFNLLFN